MANVDDKDKKIPEVPHLKNVTGNEKIPVSANGEPRYIEVTQIREGLATSEEVDKKIENALSDLDTNGYDFVDMGEAGIWSKYPIGVTNLNTIYEDMLFFTWGGIKGYTLAELESITTRSDIDRFCGTPGWDYNGRNGTEYGATKYCVNSSYGKNGFTDNLTTLEPEDDAAHVNMGGGWKMPTQEEFQKLIDLCDFEWVDDYEGTGVEGAICKLKTDETKKIFLPVSRPSTNREGMYWSSSVTPWSYTAYFFEVGKGGFNQVNSTQRTNTYPIFALLNANEDKDGGEGEKTYFVEIDNDGNLITSKEECAEIYEKIKDDNNAKILLIQDKKIISPYLFNRSISSSFEGCGFEYFDVSRNLRYQLGVSPLDQYFKGGTLYKYPDCFEKPFNIGKGLEMTPDRTLNVTLEGGTGDKDVYYVEGNYEGGLLTSKEECSEIYNKLVENGGTVILRIDDRNYFPVFESYTSMAGTKIFEAHYVVGDTTATYYNLKLTDISNPLISGGGLGKGSGIDVFAQKFTCGKGLRQYYDGGLGNVLECTLDTTPFIVVSTLPGTPATGNEGKLHLVLNSEGKDNNLYDEFLWVNNKWEKIGTAKLDVDLSSLQKYEEAYKDLKENYYTKKEIQNLLSSSNNATKLIIKEPPYSSIEKDNDPISYVVIEENLYEILALDEEKIEITEILNDELIENLTACKDFIIISKSGGIQLGLKLVYSNSFFNEETKEAEVSYDYTYNSFIKGELTRMKGTLSLLSTLENEKRLFIIK